MADFDASLPIRTTATTKLNVATAAVGDLANNIAQINGATPLTGNGVTGTGSLRVTIASDNTAFPVNATLQTGSNVIGALSANQSVNVNQVGGNAVDTGAGATTSGTQRVVLATDQGTVPVSPAPSAKTVNLSYNTASAVASSGTNTHSLTPAANAYLSQITASASGEMKIEIQYGTTGAEVSKVVLFTSSANRTAVWKPANPILITTTQTIKVMRSNLEASAMDVYSTIETIDQ